MLTNILLKLWQSVFLDCFPDEMFAEHSLFTSAVFIPFERHMCARQPRVTSSVKFTAQNSVHLL